MPWDTHGFPVWARSAHVRVDMLWQHVFSFLLSQCELPLGFPVGASQKVSEGTMAWRFAVSDCRCQHTAGQATILS